MDGMTNTPSNAQNTAKKIEATASFINKVADANMQRGANAYDFSWKGGATGKFGSKSGNYAKGSGFGGGTSNFHSHAPQPTSKQPVQQTQQAIVKTNPVSSGAAATSQNKPLHTYESNKFSSGSVRGASSAMPSKTTPSGGMFSSNSLQGSPAIRQTGPSQGSFSAPGGDSKVAVGGIRSAGKYTAGARAGAFNNHPSVSSAKIRFNTGNSTPGSLRGSINPNVDLSRVRNAYRTTGARVVDASEIDGRKAQVGAYTRISGKFDVINDAGRSVASTATSAYDDSQAVQGYRKTQSFGKMSGVSSMAKATVQHAGTYALKNRLHNPRFDVSTLDLSPYGGQNRINSYRSYQGRNSQIAESGVNHGSTYVAGFNTRRDLANNKRVLEDHFRDLKLDVRNLDAIRMNKLIKGGSIGLGGKKYSLANESDRAILAEYKALAGFEKTINNGRPFYGLRNTGKAWVDAAFSNSDAVQGLKTATSAYKAGKVSVKAGAKVSKAVVVSGIRAAGAATAVAGAVPSLVGKAGFKLSRSASARAKWGSIENLGTSLKKASKVMYGGSSRLVKFSVKDTLRVTKHRVVSKGANAISKRSKTLQRLNLFRNKILGLRSRIMNSRLVKTLSKPFQLLSGMLVGIKKFFLIIELNFS